LGALAGVVGRVACFGLDVGADVGELAPAVEQVLEAVTR